MKLVILPDEIAKMVELDITKEFDVPHDVLRTLTSYWTS
jgi:hypothetical protein